MRVTSATKQEARARIWRQFETGRLDADSATAELLSLDLNDDEPPTDAEYREPEAAE